MTVPPPDPFGPLQREVPYIAAVIFLMLVVVYSILVAPPETTTPPPEPAPMTAPGLQTAEPPPRALVAGALVLFGASLVLLGICVARLLLRKPLLPRREAPPVPWGLWDAFKIFVVFIVLPPVFYSLLGESSGDENRHLQIFLANALAAPATLAIAYHAIRIGRGAPPESLGLTRQDLLKNALIGVGGCLAFLPIYAAVAYAQTQVAKHWRIELPEQEAVRLLRTATDWRLVVLIAGQAVLIAPLVEETLFRVLLMPALRKRMRPAFAIAATAAVFAMFHPGPAFAIPIFLLGSVLGYVYDRTRSLAAPVALHMTYNALTVGLLFAYRAAA